MTENTSTNTNADAEAVSPSAKRNSLIIRGVVILGLVYFGVTEFILKEPEEVSIPEVKVKPKRIKKNIIAQEAQKTEETNIEQAPAQEPTSAEAKVDDPKIEVPNKEDLNPPVESINIAKKQDEMGAQAPINEMPAPLAEKEVDKHIDQLIEKENRYETKSQPAMEGEIFEKKEVNLLDKIVADDKYTEPPTLDFGGRGLVYNCKEKFWACTNKISYIQCNKNMKWNTANNKPSECATINVYTSDEDCSTVQKYNVSTNQPTEFCKP